MKDTKPQMQKLSEPNMDESGPSYHVSQGYLYLPGSLGPTCLCVQLHPWGGYRRQLQNGVFFLSLLHTFRQLMLRAGRCVCDCCSFLLTRHSSPFSGLQMNLAVGNPCSNFQEFHVIATDITDFHKNQNVLLLLRSPKF